MGAYADMTTDKCVALCVGYTYAGVEYANECCMSYFFFHRYIFPYHYLQSAATFSRMAMVRPLMGAQWLAPVTSVKFVEDLIGLAHTNMALDRNPSPLELRSQNRSQLRLKTANPSRQRRESLLPPRLKNLRQHRPMTQGPRRRKDQNHPLAAGKLGAAMSTIREHVRLL